MTNICNWMKEVHGSGLNYVCGKERGGNPQPEGLTGGYEEKTRRGESTRSGYVTKIERVLGLSGVGGVEKVQEVLQFDLG